MTFLNAANNAATTLSAGITVGATTIPVVSVVPFPAVPFVVTIGTEIVRVNAVDVATNMFTAVVRGQEGSTAQAHSSGTSVEHRFTAGMYRSHHDLTAPHSAVSTATANRLALRDANARLQVADGVAAADVATVGQATRNRYARAFLFMGG